MYPCAFDVLSGVRGFQSQVRHNCPVCVSNARSTFRVSTKRWVGAWRNDVGFCPLSGWFDGIEFRRISREPFDTQPPPVLLQGALRETAAVSREAIPKEDDSTPPVTPKGGEEAHEVGATDASGVEGQKPAQTPGAGGGQDEADLRQVLPVEGLVQAGRLTLGGPSGANWRSL